MPRETASTRGLALRQVMTSRARALLALIAAELAAQKADRVLKQCAGGTSIATAWRVLHAQDHKISTLIDIASALDCDVTITIVKRPAA